jgi:hypothetical protein
MALSKMMNNEVKYYPTLKSGPVCWLWVFGKGAP